MSKSISWWQPQVGTSELLLIKEVLDSNYLNDGDVTERFERRLAELLKIKHVLGVTSGTTALFAALAALGIGHGDEVIVPDITFIATANAVTWAGAKPVIVDVEEASLNMAPSTFEAAITSRTKAVIPVHVSGRSANIPEISAIAMTHNIHVVEDAAEALLSKVDGRCLGTYGKAGCLSFSPNKTITTGQGGAVLTNDDALHARLLEIKDQGRPVRGTGGNDVHVSVGYNLKLTNLQSAVGIAQLSYLESRVEKMKQIYKWYRECLEDISGISLLGFNIDAGESPQWIDAIAERRDELIQYLLAHNMHCRPFWFPIHTQAPYRLPDNKFVNSVRLAAKAFWLPSNFTMSHEDVLAVCDRIKRFFK